MHRRKSLRYGALLLVCAGLWVSSPGAPAQEGLSDPARLGIMQGFPPPPEKRVDKTNALQFPQLRWSLRDSRERAPTAGIARAHEPAPLALAPIGNLDEIRFQIGQREVSLADYLRDTHTDGFIVLHNGRVVYKRYLDSFGPREMHVWASMTKSVTGLIAAMLIEDGVLDPDARLAHYMPELAGSPFGEATVQQNLDMEVQVSYPSSLPPDLGLFAAVGFVPRREGAPDNIYDFLEVARGTTQASAGDTWYYQNEVLVPARFGGARDHARLGQPGEPPAGGHGRGARAGREGHPRRHGAAGA